MDQPPRRQHSTHLSGTTQLTPTTYGPVSWCANRAGIAAVEMVGIQLVKPAVTTRDSSRAFTQAVVIGCTVPARTRIRSRRSPNL